MKYLVLMFFLAISSVALAGIANSPILSGIGTSPSGPISGIGTSPSGPNA